MPLLLTVALWALGKGGYRRTIPWWLVLGVYLGLRLTVLNFSSAASVPPPPLDRRLLTSAEAFIRLIGLLCVPRHIHVEKSIPYSTGFTQPSTLWSLITLAAIGLLMGWVRRRSSACFVGLVWFFVCLVPMSNILPINTTLGDHWLYLPGIGLSLAVIGGLADAVKSQGGRRSLLAGYGLALAVFTGLTIRQNTIWADPKKFFELALVYSPDSFRAHNELGVLYLDEKRYDTAVKEFEASIRANPRFEAAYDNLGMVLDYQGKLEQAVDAHRRSIEINPRNPKAHNNLGNAYFKMDRLDEAAASYQNALQLNPEYLAAYNNLGVVYLNQGKRDEARRCFERVVELDPTSKSARDNLRLLDTLPSQAP